MVILTIHGFAGVFWGPAGQIIVHDIVGFCRERGIRLGEGDRHLTVTGLLDRLDVGHVIRKARRGRFVASLVEAEDDVIGGERRAVGAFLAHHERPGAGLAADQRQQRHAVRRQHAHVVRQLGQPLELGAQRGPAERAQPLDAQIGRAHV